MSLYDQIAKGFNPLQGLENQARIRLEGEQLRQRMKQDAAAQALAERRVDLQEQTLAQRLAGAATYGKSPVYGTDEKGNIVIYQLSDQGDARRVQLPPGHSPVKPLTRIDYGGGNLLVNPYTGAPQKNIPKTLSPDQTPSYRAEVTTAQEGAKREVQLKSKFPKAKTALGKFSDKVSLVKANLNRARTMTNALTAGYGAVLKDWPSSAANALANVLKTIKANIGFNELQEMRDNSPTGGALGQVSEKENELLQSVLGSLEQKQSPSELLLVYDQIEQSLDGSLGRMEEAFNADYGNFQSSNASGKGNKIEEAPQAAVDYLRQNPQFKAQFIQKYRYLPEGL